MRIVNIEELDVFVDKVPDGMDVDSYMAGVASVLEKIDALQEVAFYPQVPGITPTVI